MYKLISFGSPHKQPPLILLSNSLVWYSFRIQDKLGPQARLSSTVYFPYYMAWAFIHRDGNNFMCKKLIYLNIY